MKLFSVFSGCFRLFSVVLLLSVVFGIHKDPIFDVSVDEIIVILAAMSTSVVLNQSNRRHVYFRVPTSRHLFSGLEKGTPVSRLESSILI